MHKYYFVSRIRSTDTQEDLEDKFYNNVCPCDRITPLFNTAVRILILLVAVLSLTGCQINFEKLIPVAIATGYLVVNLKSRPSAKYHKFVKKQLAVKVFLDQGKYGRSRPIFSGYNRVSEYLGRAVESVMLGKSSPQEALKASQQRLDLIFK